MEAPRPPSIRIPWAQKTLSPSGLYPMACWVKGGCDFFREENPWGWKRWIPGDDSTRSVTFFLGGWKYPLLKLTAKAPESLKKQGNTHFFVVLWWLVCGEFPLFRNILGNEPSPSGASLKESFPRASSMVLYFIDSLAYCQEFVLKYFGNDMTFNFYRCFFWKHSGLST